MTEILALLQNIAPLFEKKTFKQLNQVIFAILVSSGRITMLGWARWSPTWLGCFSGLPSCGIDFSPTWAGPG
ncbi:MAG: hypothetical protein ABI621_15750 [Chloroflexota bacterium]